VRIKAANACSLLDALLLGRFLPHDTGCSHEHSSTLKGWKGQELKSAEQIRQFLDSKTEAWYETLDPSFLSNVGNTGKGVSKGIDNDALGKLYEHIIAVEEEQAGEKFDGSSETPLVEQTKLNACKTKKGKRKVQERSNGGSLVQLRRSSRVQAIENAEAEIEQVLGEIQREPMHSSILDQLQHIDLRGQQPTPEKSNEKGDAHSPRKTPPIYAVDATNPLTATKYEVLFACPNCCHDCPMHISSSLLVRALQSHPTLLSVLGRCILRHQQQQ
jgi:hypothetical protein